jgi:CBS domain-containing protein
MVIKGQIKQHCFEYLDNITGRRLEQTLAPGKYRHERADESPDSWAVEIMSKEVISLTPTDRVSKAIAIFKEHGIHHIPLVEKNALVGMVSDRDVMWLDLMELDKEATLSQFMSKIVIVCDDQTAIDHLAHVFYREGVNGMCVMDEKHHLIGIVTHRDILRWVFDK